MLKFKSLFKNIGDALSFQVILIVSITKIYVYLHILNVIC